MFCVCVLFRFFGVFLVFFFDQNSYLGVTHRFAQIKLTFSHVQALFSSCLRCLKSGKLRSAASFWSSRSRVVYILQEELNRFLKENII